MGTWLQSHYGHRSAVAAITRLHAVINQNYTVRRSLPTPAHRPVLTAFLPSVQVLHHHIYTSDGLPSTARVPTTLKQFKILARLGRSPSAGLYEDIEADCEFYFSEEDYLSAEELSGAVPAAPKKPQRKSASTRRPSGSRAVKCETSPTPGPSSASAPISAAGPSSGPQMGRGAAGKKRPRRSAASSVKSYVVPDSDDEDIVMGEEDPRKLKGVQQRPAKKRRAESNLQRWIKQLTILFKEEQRKVRPSSLLLASECLGTGLPFGVSHTTARRSTRVCG